MAITNISKPSTSLSNQVQPDRGITWASITTTWATETETWGEVSTLFTNSSKPSTSITNITRPS